ncbi:INO80 complex subunit C [Teleopsis dalmanni]|uniref:INO80 complex subunit C n=1 Tax=Teleopsis dalmanni TaxID=139649 RepID=UPI0018CD7C57|nr:INO80 complex subunit C [Teleopsis dalmanni]
MSEEQSKCKFKNPNFTYTQPGNKKLIWKSLKQIMSTEKSLTWPEDAVTYSSLSSPPSFRPAKKYSDISGLIAPYTDPQTKLHYHNAEEYAIVKELPSDITAGYLNLRGASSIV